jgi:hypothetical protein
MEDKLKKGDVVVDTHGDVVLISRTNVQSEEPDSQGRIFIFAVGTYLRSASNQVGSRWSGQDVRVVCHVSDLLKLAVQSGYDIVSPAETPDSALSTVELLQRQVKQLQEALQKITPQTSTDAVARPRAGIEALQQK